ncbi:phage holin family protein [Flavobacterium sp.]|uniref:phage holin family protein n=1 Tax=Flavobacterium sp. TaxID=239 RepID=UPI002632E661|nr:phage holin family protein [Flavobacterium sp.]MDD2986699.1 phage holin family protein [Flavobacterium sp.]
MESAVKNIEMLYEKAKEYTNTTLELYKLTAVDKAAEVISSLSFRIAFLLIAAFFTLFFNIGLSLYLGELLDSNAAGFFIVSLFYLVFGLLLYIFRQKWIKSPISNLIIKELLYSKRKDKSYLKK